MLSSRAFSLVEVCLSLVIGLVVTAGVTQLAIAHAAKVGGDRRALDTRGSLDMAREELRLKTRGLEPAFFTAFPLKAELLLAHPTDHTHGALQLTRDCPERPGTSCLIWWDIVPPDENPYVYAITDDDGRGRLGLIAVNPAVPAGLPKALDKQSVLLFLGETSSFCRLVEEIEGYTVVLADEVDQPWPQVGLYMPQTTRVVHLGRLEVVHCTLTGSSIGRKLVYAPWRLGETGWQRGRATTSYNHLQGLAWVPCSADWDDRIVLLAQPDQPRALGRPLEIAGRVFDEEVYSAAIFF